MKPMLLTGSLLLLSGCAGISSAPLTDEAYLPVSAESCDRDILPFSDTCRASPATK
jgi:hypothetical protein